MSETITAEMARQMVAENEKRNQLIEEFIADTNKRIRNACKDGERKCGMTYRKYKWEEPYKEVLDHFKELGYEIKIYGDGSGYYLAW